MGSQVSGGKGGDEAAAVRHFKISRLPALHQELRHDARVEIARLVLDYLKVLIWPAATVAIVYGFRSQLSDLIRRVKALSAPGIDAEFSGEIIEASTDAEVAVLNNESAGGEVPDQRGPGEEPTEAADVRIRVVRVDEEDRLLSYARLQPEAAAVAAWWFVEAELRRLEEVELGVSDRRPLPITRVIDRLNLPQNIKISILELSKVRNRAAHHMPLNLSPEAARAYVSSCREMADWLQARGHQQPLF
ncbi:MULTISPECIES: hypothetical protein [unclassified Streptomyces]|uniref:hypothetical protein n=1 Tax=unclassified Streptomyces TaxID=2593676 RepID=UPI00114C91A5|nr:MULTISPECIES: hypothetical protein [unclassified Streptomyces]MYR99012.1 hypothetical protein [Streptomyces sp. SID4940]MYT63743.1 hypothetical protein [Streptomyces sp. SID8357]MYT85993.1 hypothetical protein [Streptomyces sp. SID8360]MYW38456.1 hypothetical protein [Streptomyces sp. SID1]